MQHHVIYTIVDRYDNERETWSKSITPCLPTLVLSVQDVILELSYMQFELKLGGIAMLLGWATNLDLPVHH